jgi:hypothetical protein
MVLLITGTLQAVPEKYFHLRVAKNFKEPETEALLYGTQVHEAAESTFGMMSQYQQSLLSSKNNLRC